MCIRDRYEEGVGANPYPAGGELRGLNTSSNYGPNMKYSSGLDRRTSGRLTYRKGEIPTVSPGTTGKIPISWNNTTIIAGDEEEGTLSRAEIKSAIQEELEDANPDCTFALDALAKKLGIKIEYPN